MNISNYKMKFIKNVTDSSSSQISPSGVKITTAEGTNTVNADKIALTTNAKSITLDNSTATPSIVISKGDILSNQIITPTTLTINGLNRESVEISTYSTTSNDINPNNFFVQSKMISDINNLSTGHYADYGDGEGTLSRVFTGFNSSGNPSIGAYSGSSVYTLESSPLFINSNLDLQNTYTIVGAKSIDNSGNTMTIGPNINSTNNGITIGNTGTKTLINGQTTAGGMTLDNNSIALCSSIDNSGNTMTIGPNINSTNNGITIGNTGTKTLINGQTTAGGMTLDNNGIALCSSIDNSGNTITIGKTGGTTVINGTLKSASVLDMIGNGITNCSYIDNSNYNVNIGIQSAGVNIGNTGTKTIINGQTTAGSMILSNKNITLCSSIDNSGNTITIGKTGGTTVINGTLKSASVLDMTGNGIINCSSIVGTITLGNSSTSTVRTNKPLDLNYLPSSISTDINSNQLGYNLVSTPTITPSISANTITKLSSAILRPGIWILTANATFIIPVIVTEGFFTLSISSSPSFIQNECCSSMTTLNNSGSINITRVVKTTNSQNWYLLGRASASCIMSDIVFDIYRIA